MSTGAGPPIGVQVVTIAKAPEAGKVKTRLCPPCDPGQAASVARAALTDTLAAVGAAPVCRRVLVLDGAAGRWLPSGYEVLPQRGGGLDERIAGAFDDAFATCARPVLLVGMDTPQLTPGLLADAARRLLAGDAVLGPARDGGFWSLGLRRPRGDLVRGVAMSSETTGDEQVARLHAAGLRVALLEQLVDVDTAADADLVARAAPDTAFARRWAEVVGAAGTHGRVA